MKLGKRNSSCTPCCRSSTDEFVLAVAAAIFIGWLYLVQIYFKTSGREDVVEQRNFLRPPKPLRGVKKTNACRHLPSVYWINLDKSKERRYALETSMELTGLVNQHRVAAYDAKQVVASMDSKQLVFHPLIKIYAGDENPSFWKHPMNIYTFNEAACLMSHLTAIKQAYDDGHEVALIAEDDALFSSFFCGEYDKYVAQAPIGWKVLQFATNNPHVVMQGALMHEPFISWQRYHHSTRAYLINREGMETLLGKVHSTDISGKSIWSIQEFPSVVADEAVYTLIGDTYYSTGLWVGTSELDSTIQNKNKPKTNWDNPYAHLEEEKSKQLVMKTQATPAQLFDRSLLVVMNVCISNESQIEREIEVINQDIHAVCKFHRVCEWEINVVAVHESLTSQFKKAASGLPSYAHIHTKVHSNSPNKFLIVGDIVSKLANFDLMLFKDNDQRINGFPWRTFIEHSDNAVLSSPLRSTQRDYMLTKLWNRKKSRDITFHDVNHWLFKNNGRDWHRQMYLQFNHIKPVEVPLLESYFVLLDAKFAKHFFERTFASGGLVDSSMEYRWCWAAFDWDSKRPSCNLIPLASTHEDSLNNMKEDAFTINEPDTNYDESMSLAREWRDIVGHHNTILETEKLCLKRMEIEFVDADDDAAYEGIPIVSIGDCARLFLGQYSLPGEASKSNPLALSSSASTTNTQQKQQLEFVHITKTGGSAVEKAAANVGINWGACHYMEVEEVGCSSPDLPYDAPDFQSYALTSPWHTPPKLLKLYVDESRYPYNDVDLFTIVRNPYSRVLSEYHCPWTGFQPKYRKNTVHEKDPSDPIVMNEWVKSMLKSLESEMNKFKAKNMDKVAKFQAKSMNEDSYILAQKHYVNQAEYVYDGDKIIVKNVVHYENLSSELDVLMKKYDINLTLSSKDEGVYSDANIAKLTYKDLDPEAIALINNFARVDFEKFGYEMVEKKFDEHYSLEAKIIV